MKRRIPPVLLAAVCLAGVVLPGWGQDVQRSPLASDRAYVPKLGWKAAAEQIGEALRKGYRPGRAGMTSSVGSPAFQSWLLMQRWAELVSRDETEELAGFLGRYFFSDAGDGERRFVFVGPGIEGTPELVPLEAAELRLIVGDADMRRSVTAKLLPTGYEAGTGEIGANLDPEFLAAMVADEEFLRAFFANFSERDFLPLVLRNLEAIWKTHREDWKAYRNLAIALAVVYDQVLPVYWPHPQVRPAAVPLREEKVEDRFAYWVKANAGSKLFTDLRKLEPEHLKFVVDAPIDPAEFDWAQANAKFPRTDFGKAFSAIAYDRERIMTQQFVWPGATYRLADIAEMGGICVDQAYFAMVSGKARGLPTLYFRGQGADGGHAWFGYMKGEDRWDMDCGRYENQGYAVGEALDPQTWRGINDHALQSLAKNFRRTPGYLASQADLAMARVLAAAGDEAGQLAALNSAVETSPANDNAWEAKSAFLERTGAGLEERRAHHERALAQFANDEDLKARQQLALARIARESGDEAAARDYESKLIAQNRRGRSDLSVSVAAGRLTSLVGEKKLDDAMAEYRALTAQLARTSGGNFFYEIVRPFSLTLLESGDEAAARQVVDQARSALRPESGSILDQDLAELSARIGGGGR